MDDRAAPDVEPLPSETVPAPTELTPPTESPPAARQRWRLVVARGRDAPALAQRDLTDAWLAAIDAAGLPLARTEGATPRPRISFGAPLPLAMVADGELIDLVLTDRWPGWRLREALEPVIPDGWRLMGLEDVWLGGPPLAGRVAAADYRITIAAASSSGAAAGPSLGDALRVASTRLIESRQLLRERAKGDRVVSYDLRPLLIDVRVASDGPPIVLTARTRFHPELGTGRPEEVVAALAAAAGLPLAIDSIVRARVLLVDDLDEG